MCPVMLRPGPRSPAGAFLGSEQAGFPEVCERHQGPCEEMKLLRGRQDSARLSVVTECEAHNFLVPRKTGINSELCFQPASQVQMLLWPVASDRSKVLFIPQTTVCGGCSHRLQSMGVQPIRRLSSSKTPESPEDFVEYGHGS